MTSSDNGGRFMNAISKSICFKCCSSSEPQFTKEEQEIYLGDHMTRSWTRDERSGAKQATPPVTQEPGNKTPGTPSVYHTQQSHAPVGRTRSSIREPRGSRRNWAIKSAIQNLSPEEFNEWKQSFEHLLQSPTGSKEFRLFLESEIAEENLLFWEACEQLKQMKKEKRMQKLIQSIFDDYISVYSVREINIDYKMREDIVAQLHSSTAPGPDIFEEAQLQIYHLMHRDSYPRFIAYAQTIQDEKKRETRRQHKEPEARRKSGSRVLCCYGHDPDMHDRTEEMKVQESPPANGKTRSNIQTFKLQGDRQTDEEHCESASSGKRTDTISSLKVNVKDQKQHLAEVTPPGLVETSRKFSDGATDSNSKRESGIELISFGSNHCDDADVVIEKYDDVIDVTATSMSNDVTQKKISSVEVPVQVIKGPDDSGIVANEDSGDVMRGDVSCAVK